MTLLKNGQKRFLFYSGKEITENYRQYFSDRDGRGEGSSSEEA